MMRAESIIREMLGGQTSSCVSIFIIGRFNTCTLRRTSPVAFFTFGQLSLWEFYGGTIIFWDDAREVKFEKTKIFTNNSLFIAARWIFILVLNFTQPFYRFVEVTLYLVL